MLCKLREQNPAFFASYDAKKGEISSRTTIMTASVSASVSTSTMMMTSSGDARPTNSSSSEEDVDDDEGNCNNNENENDDGSSSDDDAVVPLSACNAVRFSRELSNCKQRELRQSQALSRLSLLAHREGASTPL